MTYEGGFVKIKGSFTLGPRPKKLQNWAFLLVKTKILCPKELTLRPEYKLCEIGVALVWHHFPTKWQCFIVTYKYTITKRISGLKAELGRGARRRDPHKGQRMYTNYKSLVPTN